MQLTSELIDLKLDLNSFMCETSNKCDVSFFKLVKALNSTNFEVSTPLRAAFNPLNTTMNNIKTDSMSVEEVDTFSRFQMQLKSMFESTVMYIEIYSLGMFSQISNTPVSMLMQQMDMHVRMFLETFAMALERNPTCARPLIPKWIPSLQIIPDTCIEIVENSMKVLPDKYEPTFGAVNEAVIFLRSLNNKFTLCAGSTSVGKCIRNWIASTFECIGCSSAYEPFNYVMGNHSTGISNITITAHMEMNGMQSLVLNNEVMDATRSCENSQM